GPPPAGPAGAVAPDRAPRLPRLTFHGSVLVMTLATLLLMAVPPARQLWREHTREAAARERLADLREDNDRMERHLERLRDPNYVERVAREKLGLVRPGEIGYVVVPAPAPEEQERDPEAGSWFERTGRALLDLLGVG
ncbi:MAG: FtsB family cell division protein, partial [Actinomycetota bacterium]